MTWIQEDNSINDNIFLKKQDNKNNIIKKIRSKHKEDLIRYYDFLLEPEEITRYMREQKQINMPNKFDLVKF